MNSKGLEIDTKINKAPFDKERAFRIWDKIKEHIPLNRIKIHVLGTNGKGSTGRYITKLLLANNKSVFHFTSPHLYSFNERFYKNGKILSFEECEDAHQFLQKLDGIKEASFFEYATFLALVLSNGCEYLVMEAGCGGEFDATNCIDYDLSIFTSISFDHTDLLGHKIEDIAKTKLRAMGKTAILAPQQYKATIQIAKEIAGARSDLHVLEDDKNVNFLDTNLSTARYAINLLGLKGDRNKDEVELDLFGRFHSFAPNIIIDVGHNADAAKAVLSAFLARFGDNKFTLIYNSYKNKDIKSILLIFKNYLKEVLILPIFSPRIVQKSILCGILKELEIPFADFRKESLVNSENYLVFGSFKVAEIFSRY